MKNIFTRLRLIIILFSLFFVKDINAYNLRGISSKNGLSNSAVIRIYKDSKNVMWIGTYDGLNLYDGININVYKPTGKQNSISGNIIRQIIETDVDIFWIQTNLGIDKFDRSTGVIETFHKRRIYTIAKNSKDNIFSIYNTDSISMYDRENNIFRSYALNPKNRDILKHFSFDSNNILWIVTNHGVITRYKIETNDNVITSINNMTSFDYPEEIVYAFSSSDKLFVVGNKGSLSEIDRNNMAVRFIRNIKKETDQYGVVSDILADDNDILISLTTNGVLRLYPNSIGEYEVEKINLDYGVFSMYKDTAQKIVWFATDGQGAIMYSKDYYSFRSETFNMHYDKISKPVRGIFLDKNNNLWIGTKGDGILKINNYNQGGRISIKDLSMYKMENSELVNNSVFTFALSKKNLFWIGSDGPGINYYSYKTNRIHKLESSVTTDFRYIQSIYEQNDSILWLGSSGEGLVKLTLSYRGDVPVIKKREYKAFFESGNRYYSIIPENDSIIWIGSRINGAIRFNTKSEQHQTIHLKEEAEQLMNDILCVFKDSNNTIWFGTSLGLNRLISFDNNRILYKNYNESNGLPNNTIHGILEDENGILWLSTNKGIVEFNYQTETFSSVNSRSGIDIIEFSDNAYFQHEEKKELFFGGVNGIVSIIPDGNESHTFHPDITFFGLKVYGNEVNIHSYLKQKNKSSFLEIPYNNNFFSISFIAIDYVNGPNYIYEYKLENFSDQWINNSTSNSASFTNIPPGHYTLKIRYMNTNLQQVSETFSLNIRITPPFYLTTIAYIIYGILVLLVIVLIIRIVKKWYHMKKKMVISKMRQEQKEMIYESQFRFFTNITHELCTPLTLIQGPCEKIIENSYKNEYINKYAHVIRRNVEKLNLLINELIDFRRLETESKRLEISEIDLSKQMVNLCEAFTDLAESKNIKYNFIISDDILWNTDESCYSKIVTNLISNAFKYTYNGGEVRVEFYVENGKLTILISNTGKGIEEEDIPKIFDRYRILDNFGMQNDKGISSRNGLGLAICDSMVKLLKGEIVVSSILNEITTFKVILPPLSAEFDNTDKSKITLDTGIISSQEEIPVLDIDLSKFDKSKPTILIVDDDEQMLWFVTDIFVKKYNVISILYPTMVLEFLQNYMVNLIIMDIMMPGIDGISLTKKIKSNKMLAHIPLILLSAKGNNESRIEGIDSGAEIYVTKPFSTEYIEKVVNRLLQRDEELKEYYNSSLSAFDLEEGRLIHKEDKAFYEKLVSIIDHNLSNTDLSVEKLSQSLGISVRHFYRRLKKITDVRPYELIKEYRLRQAEKLLVSTNLSIDEIIYKVGFGNRGNFFRLFSQRHNMTPKKYREKNMAYISSIRDTK
jgi:signal transduction histidine kinase/DNA-binding response OmpR family regulator/ligand-binding sensor domain-containing protein